MPTTIRLQLVLIGALSFTFLFYQSGLGINWFIFNCLLIGATYILDTQRVSRLRIISSISLVVSSFFYAIHGVGWNFFVSLIALVVFSGVTAEPYFRSLSLSVQQSLRNLAMSSFYFIKDLHVSSSAVSRILSGSLRYYYLVVPMVIILVFISMYSYASPFFGAYLGDFGMHLSDAWSWMSNHFNWQWFWLFVLGIFISAFILVPVYSGRLQQLNATANENLQRFKRPFAAKFGLLGLKKEYRAGLFLLVALNLLLLIFNALDLYHVWIHFEWNGEFLKQFVHEGTWMLVVSIFISIGLVLYFFRGNLNFYPARKTFKVLTYIWIAQNVFLAFSVGLRNWYYLQHFALAYKRIAVMFFLALVIYGLYTVFVKVRRNKTRHYLLRTNLLAIFLVFMLSATVNWDVFIARYNFAHHETGYLHYNFLAGMHSSAIPYMDYDLNTLCKMEAARDMRYPEVQSNTRAESFHSILHWKKKSFLRRQENKSWKAWTLADARTLEYLKTNPPRDKSH